MDLDCRVHIQRKHDDCIGVNITENTERKQEKQRPAKPANKFQALNEKIIIRKMGIAKQAVKIKFSRRLKSGSRIILFRMRNYPGSL